VWAAATSHGVRAEEDVERADERDCQARALATLVVPTYNAVALSVLHVDDFAFDVELLARARQAGLRIVETGVAFRCVDPTTVVMLRHGRQKLVEVLRLRRALRRYPVGAQSGSCLVPVADRP